MFAAARPRFSSLKKLFGKKEVKKEKIVREVDDGLTFNIATLTGASPGASRVGAGIKNKITKGKLCSLCLT